MKQPFHVMTKPIGPICNLDCTYCYYLSKEGFSPKDEKWQMTDERLENYIRQYIESQPTQEIQFAWQGGEPTLLGVEFFEKVIELQQKHCPANRTITNALQTNGTLLNDRWGEFFYQHNFLVGLSIDGPAELHNVYRVNKNQKATFHKVIQGVEILRKHKVEHNFLVVVNRLNAQKPLEVYRFLRDEMQAKFIQFIPCVEPKDFEKTAPQHWSNERVVKLNDPDAHPGGENSIVTEWTVDPDDYGTFLCTIFDEWLKNDVGKVFVQIFDVALGQWMGMGSSLCVFSETCGSALALEHDGNIYSCDHYVYPEFKLGSIDDAPLIDLVNSDRQKKFGRDKKDSLPDYCRECEVLFACNGECPKNRFIHTPDSQPGLNYLCVGFRKFFNHIDPWMKRMADEVRLGRTAADAVSRPLRRRRRKKK